ncbi:Receptor-like protein EIX2 [Camellia lanceoleosa]|uniref:Receptor-like protein EIX2 n=1 Tax=Camellia lanceoleosa TaxID=1840588 RepID=A0ACC0HGQ2_9ERIC|nr:Receptor-like protein EIX2 [Camellia lanceoleosa]
MQTSVGILSLIGFLTIAAIDFSFCNGNHDVVVMCREGEKQTLLQFKKDLEDPTNGLSSWEVEDDCCKWEGVVCDNFTGHVLELNLRNSYTDGIVDYVYQRYDKFKLNGKINPCLQKLKHLKYLDLSENNFTNIPFPPVIASMTQLQYINLSNAGFAGTIPHQLGNLSSYVLSASKVSAATVV